MRPGALLLVYAAVCCGAEGVRVGQAVPAFDLMSLDGKPEKVEPTSRAATVVVFISANCPISNAFNYRMSAVYRDYTAKGVRFLFVNSNVNESAAEVADHRRAAGFPFPVFRDAENRAANLLGAMATPESYVIGPDGRLRYHGFIEDSVNEARVKRRGLRDALDAVLAGKNVESPETKAFGCTIKRLRRTT